MKMRKILLSLTVGLLAAGASAQMKFVDRGVNVYCRFSPNCQVSPTVQTRADAVFAAWKEHADQLETGQGDSAQRIETALDELNGEIRNELLTLH